MTWLRNYDEWKAAEPAHDYADDYTEGVWRCDACEYDKDCSKCWRDNKCQCECRGDGE